MTTRTRSRLRDAAAFFAFLGGISLAVYVLVPPAVAQRINQLQATAAPEIEALREREAAPSHLVPESQPAPQESKNRPNGDASKTSKVIRNARITTYQAVREQTDDSPCVGAMAGVDFCHQPFPIVANNCLALGSQVRIFGGTYTVADRMNARYGCNTFDVLNEYGLPDYADVEVL